MHSEKFKLAPFIYFEKNATNCMTAKLYKSFFTNASHTEFFFLDFFAFLPFFCDIFQTASIHQSIEIDNQVELGRRAVFFSSSAASQIESSILFCSQQEFLQLYIIVAGCLSSIF